MISRTPAPWVPEPQYTFSPVLCGVIVGVVAFFIGALGTLVMFQGAGEGAGKLGTLAQWGTYLLICIPAWESAFIWVALAAWFRRRNVSVFKAALVGAVSAPVAALVPFFVFGFWVFLQQPGFAIALGACTGVLVRFISTSVRVRPRAV